MKKKWLVALGGMIAVSGLAACGNDEEAGGSNGKTQIEFFQYKSEAKGTFEELIKQFEEQNPDIDVVQANPPDAMTVIKTRIAKRDIPDVIGMGGDINYKEFVDAGVLEELTDHPAQENVQDAYKTMLHDISGAEGLFGIPYAANASAVIYNKAIFDELGIAVPQTWEEFIAAAEQVKAAGKIPFYFTFKDAWTTLPSYNALGANTQPEDFFVKRNAGEVTFSEGYKEATDKFLELLEYGHPDQNGQAYTDGNTAFANGESAMYLQGIWAIPEIKKANPDIEIGVFPYPVGDASVVSGVDLLIAKSSQTEKDEAADKFIEFLTSEETAKEYISQQFAFSAQEGIVQEDPSLEGLKASFEAGNLVDFPDHYVPAAVGLDRQLQVLTTEKDAAKFLKDLDSEWDKVAERQ